MGFDGSSGGWGLRLIESDSDIQDGLAALAGVDARLALMIELSGPVPLRRRPPGYGALAEIIVSQMVSKASAAALWRKLEERIGEVKPQTVLAMDEETGKAAGLSRAKAETLKRIAESVSSQSLDLDSICSLPAEIAIKQLTGIKGVGPWTAEVYLLFCAGHPDIFPAGDVALQSAAAHAFELEKRPDIKNLRALVAPFSPWRGVAARLFWAYYATHMNRDATPLGD